METFFLVCFLFGALFIVASVVLGFTGSHIGGQVDHAGHLGQGGHQGSLAHGSHHAPGGHGGNVAHGHGHADARLHPAQMGDHTATIHGPLPLFNVASALAFLTWFGAAGYLLLHFAVWPLLVAMAGAVAAGGAGSLLITLFLGKVLAGEREMDPRDYCVEGTIARVTVSIPANGVGEIVFTKAGARRSEAARNLNSRPVPRETEVVVIDYTHGLATIQTWDEFLARTKAGPPGQGIPSAGDSVKEGES